MVESLLKDADFTMDDIVAKARLGRLLKRYWWRVAALHFLSEVIASLVTLIG